MIFPVLRMYRSNNYEQIRVYILELSTSRGNFFFQLFRVRAAKNKDMVPYDTRYYM